MSMGSGGGHGEAAGDMEMEEHRDPPPLFCCWQQQTMFEAVLPVVETGVDDKDDPTPPEDCPEIPRDCPAEPGEA